MNEQQWDQARIQFIAAALTGLVSKVDVARPEKINAIAELAVQIGSITCAELDEWLAS